MEWIWYEMGWKGMGCEQAVLTEWNVLLCVGELLRFIPRDPRMQKEIETNDRSH